ncbi:MAG: hypothetical protein M3O50_05140, partial [Myxococcota bacterium]|nr:hypothetical protein [Myxococcota bacterium]
AIDRSHDLHDRLASALTFGALPERVRTPFMRAAIDDAIDALPIVRPERAVPLCVPRALFAALGLAAGLAGVLLFEVRHHVFVATVHRMDPVNVEPDDLEEVNDFLRQVAQRDTGDDTRRAIDEFNTLVADISNERLDRTEAFRRMQALEQKLVTGSPADKKALETQLDRIAEGLKNAELTRPAGEALAERRFERARDKLHELAKNLRDLRDGRESVDKSKLDQLRQALKTAAADAEKRRDELQHRRQDLADEILKMKQRAGDSGSDEERSLLEKKQRELERMDRELDQQNKAEQGLDRLDRELAQAASDLMKDLGLSAQDLDQGAEDLNRLQQQQATEEQKQELRQKLQELRELVRQQGSGGKGRMVRLERFARAAHGQGASGQQGGVPQEGEGDGSEGSEHDTQGQEASGADGDGRGGQGAQANGGSKGGSRGEGGGTWVLGPNHEKMLMLSKAPAGGAAQDRGDGNGGGGQARGGHRWGDGHDPKIQGDATNPKMGTEDTQVHADDTGQGGSRSQVILGAAERGFVSHGYKKVFTEYHQVAEESLAKDDIPGGYRSYVKRYFQLIRPRDGQ